MPETPSSNFSLEDWMIASQSQQQIEPENSQEQQGQEQGQQGNEQGQEQEQGQQGDEQGQEVVAQPDPIVNPFPQIEPSKPPRNRILTQHSNH